MGTWTTPPTRVRGDTFGKWFATPKPPPSGLRQKIMIRQAKILGFHAASVVTQIKKGLNQEGIRWWWENDRNVVVVVVEQENDRIVVVMEGKQ